MVINRTVFIEQSLKPTPAAAMLVLGTRAHSRKSDYSASKESPPSNRCWPWPTDCLLGQSHLSWWLALLEVFCLKIWWAKPIPFWLCLPRDEKSATLPLLASASFPVTPSCCCHGICAWHTQLQLVHLRICLSACLSLLVSSSSRRMEPPLLPFLSVECRQAV